MKIIILSLICGLWSAMAGSDDYPKFYRRYGVPLLLAISLSLIKSSFLFFLILPLILAYTMGHGVPDKDDDDPSTLGGMLLTLTTNESTLNILIRSIVGLTKCLFVIAIPLITGEWQTYMLCSIGIVTSNVVFGGDTFIKEGMFKLFKTKLNWEELIIVAIDAGLIYTMALI